MKRPGNADAPTGIFLDIWEVVARVPRGRVTTYGQIARMAGCPGGARTVGWAMRALPDGLLIRGSPVPWQRVINAQGRISPRRSGAPGDDAVRQARALRREGVPVSSAGTVDLTQCLWNGRAQGKHRRTGGGV